MLGKYERLDVLGHGASGIVYLAKDTLLGRQIALKEISAQGEERDRVLEEARVLDRLRHPNIVRVYGVDEIGGKVVLAMEYVRGRNLQDVLRRAPQLPVSEAVSVAAQICDGLAFAHQHRIVHRDIKPANILIASDGVVKLVDFGLAQVLGTNSFAGGAGTYAYMAPEDFHEERLSDHQADIWAVGVILYEMLTGRRPFQAVKVKDPFSWRRAVEETPWVPVTELRPDVPAAVGAILAHALARDKRARYADAAEMAEDLRAAAAASDGPYPLADGPHPGGKPPTLSQICERVDPPAGTGGGHPRAALLLSPDEPPLTDIDGFLLGAPGHWDAARAALASGALAEWLEEIGETPLAEVAREMTTGGGREPDDQLRDFLYRAGLDTAPEAQRAADEGVRLARAGRFTEAVPPLQRAVHLDPSRPSYHQDLAGALRASGDGGGAARALEEALRHHPQQRVLQKQYADLAGAQAALSSSHVDFGTLRRGQSRAATVTVSSAGGGVVEGRVTAAPGWVRVEPSAFSTRRRQRLTLTADASSTGPAPAEYNEAIVLDTAGGRLEIAVHAAVLPARRSLSGIFWWYLPLLVCCLLPALAGLEAGGQAHAGGAVLLAPGMAGASLLCGALFVLTCAADTAWGPRLTALFLFGMTALGAWPLVPAFADGTDPAGRVALVQTAIPALVMLILQSVAVYADPRRWGRWPLWGWITAATGLLISYGLLHTAAQ